MFVIALTVVIATFWAIGQKRLQPTPAFLLGGVLVFVCAVLSPNGLPLGTAEGLQTLRAFIDLAPVAGVIAISFGFAGIVRHAGYTGDFVNLAARLAGARKTSSPFPFLTAAVLATGVGSFALNSANASCGVVAPVLGPLLLGLGLPGPVAGAAIVSGGWGAVVSPADINANSIQDVLHRQKLEALQIGQKHWLPALASTIAIVCVFAFATRRGPFLVPTALQSAESGERRNHGLRALIPLLPFALLALHAVLRHPGQAEARWGVVGAMAVGSLVAGAYSYVPGAIGAFGRGAWKGVSEVVVLLIASKVFIEGVKLAIPSALAFDAGAWAGTLPVAASSASFGFATLTGSGDAIVTSMVQWLVPVLPHGPLIPPSVVCSMVWFAGEMGRCTSPIAAATITTARVTNADPSSVARAATAPVVIGALAAFVVLWLQR